MNLEWRVFEQNKKISENKIIYKLNTIENIVLYWIENWLEKNDLILLKKQIEIIRQYIVFKKFDYKDFNINFKF